MQVQQLKKSKRLVPLYIWLRNQRMMQLDGNLGACVCVRACVRACEGRIEVESDERPR